MRKRAPRHPAPAPAPAPTRRRSAGPGTPAPRVQLAWARDRDGKMMPISAVDPKARRARAPFSCPGCEEVLVPHLGQQRARHFAHVPGASCPLTAPETALHFNAKERLLALCGDAFGGRRQVTLLTRCARCRRVDARELAALGDAAESEGAIGTLRADVLVRAGGRPALAFEVLVTHAVDPEKEAALAAASVPAVEIDAREEWLLEAPDAPPPEFAGHITLGRVEVVCLRSLGFPPCPACATEARADDDRDRGGEDGQIAELERYRARGLFGPVRTGPLPASGPAPARFRCPDCGTGRLIAGPRLVQHPCPGRGDRPVAWVGYDGALVTLRWWAPT